MKLAIIAITRNGSALARRLCEAYPGGADVYLPKRFIPPGDKGAKPLKEDLAGEVVERYWGKEAAVHARSEFASIFKDKGVPEEVPVFELAWEGEEMWVPRIMKIAGLCAGTGEAVRLIKQGGVHIDERRIDDPETRLGRGEHLFKVGKRKFMKIRAK